MKAKGILFTFLSAVLYGIAPVFSSKSFLLGSNAVTLTFYREFLVLPLLLATLLLRRVSLRVTRRQLATLFLAGILGRGATTLMLNIAYGYIGVGTATTLHFMYPVFVALICRTVFRERLGRAKLMALALATGGVFFFLEGEGAGGAAGLGLGLALVSGFTYGSYIVAADKTCIRELDPFLIAFYTAIAVDVGMLGYNAFAREIIFRLPPKAMVYTFLAAVAASFLAVSFLQIGVRYLSATTAAVFSLLEPVSCTAAGAVWLGEIFTPAKAAGSVIILGAAGLLASAKPEVSPDSQAALDLLMSPEGFPHPPEGEEKDGEG